MPGVQRARSRLFQPAKGFALDIPFALGSQETLQAELPIPVFHDDQHGTAIIVGAALLSGLEVQGKSSPDVRVVIVGAGAAGIACADMVRALGVGERHVLLMDSRGVVHTERQDLNPYKRRLATTTSLRTLSDALTGADVLIGVSNPDIVNADMLRSMASRPLVSAPSNPEPEVPFEVVRQVRPDAVFASGRSDTRTRSTTCSPFPRCFARHWTCVPRGSIGT